MPLLYSVNETLAEDGDVAWHMSIFNGELDMPVQSLGALKTFSEDEWHRAVLVDWAGQEA